MTFNKLKKIIETFKIPDNVILQSDSGWECSETEMDGVYYNKNTNTIIFTQEISKYDKYFISEEWIILDLVEKVSDGNEC